MTTPTRTMREIAGKGYEALTQRFRSTEHLAQDGVS